MHWFQRSRVAFCAALLVFICVFVMNAWMADDAYITLRTVDNVVNGHGLTWNVGERVQAYSHPLWLFPLTAAYAATREAFYTPIALSFLFCFGTLLVLYRAFEARDLPWKASLVVLLLVGCKAFIDFCSSGLENPLSYLLATSFFSTFLFREREAGGVSRNEVLWLCFLAALAFTNRYDTILLYLPALALVVDEGWKRNGRWFLPWALLAASPAVLWVVFATFYYGTPIPNTAYAKVLTHGVPLIDKLRRGVGYLADSLVRDLPSYLFVLAATWWALRERSRARLATMGGVLLYAGYATLFASTATHMSGRFFALPLLVGILVFADSIAKHKTAWAAASVAVLFLVLSPTSPLKSGTDLYEFTMLVRFYDTKEITLARGSSFLGSRRSSDATQRSFLRAGEALREGSVDVVLGGAARKGAVGLYGFGAGPSVHIVDHLGLADPLLSRLPACNVGHKDFWVSGHFVRMIPEGYAESLVASDNRIRDPDLRRYYEKVRLITRGPLWDGHRLLESLKLGVGAYDSLLASYRGEIERRFSSEDCTPVVRALLGPVKLPEATTSRHAAPDTRSTP